MNAIVNAESGPSRFAESIGTYVRDVVRARGSVKVCFAGDSHIMGNDTMGGLSLPIAMMLADLGIPCTYVGQNSLSAGNDRFMYNTFGNVTKVHAEGGITTATFLAGDSTLGNKTWAQELDADRPDIIFLCLGSNDTSPGVQLQYEEVLSKVFSYRADVPVVWMSPFASNSATVEYYNVDTSRAATKETIRAACANLQTRGRAILVDSDQALGMWAWYPIDPTPVVPASTDTGAETVTFTSDPGWYSGQEVTVTATGGNLTAGTTYYVNRASSTTYTFHTTRANGVSGSSPVNLSASITAGVYANFLTAGNNNANAVFYDSAHLSPEGYMMIAAHAVAMLFGMNVTDVVKMVSAHQPYAPSDGSFGAAISATTTVLCRGGSRKRVFTNLTFNNTDTSLTSTVTILKVRYSLDGTTIARPYTVKTFTVGPGDTRGWSWNYDSDPGARGGIVCHYNEGLSVTTATAACSVEAEWKNAVA